MKEIKRPEALDINEFGALHEGVALQNLNQFCHISYREEDRTFTSQAWNKLFRIHERVVREYVMKFLSSFTFRDHIVDLDNVDTMVFQLGAVKRSMTIRHFILALGLYTPEEMGNVLFEPFRKSCFRNRPNNYNLAEHIGKEKLTLDDLFLLHSMDGGVMVDVPWHVAKFFTDKAKGYKKKSLIVGAHLNGRIARYNGLGYGELVDDIPDHGEDEGAANAGNNDAGGVRRRPNMSFTNRLRAMDERLGEMETDISKLGSDVDDLTYIVSRMSEQYDQFYGEFRHMRMEQERFQTWNIDHLSQLLSHHHIAHTRYDGTHYSYVPNIPDLRVQQGVNFKSSTSVYSIAPSQSPFPNLFGLFGDANARPSTSQNQGKWTWYRSYDVLV
ncbi:hypothetical protein Tco_0666581 [Tanacetum coccineum]